MVFCHYIESAGSDWARTEDQFHRVLATNLFERISEMWLLIHHYGSAVMGHDEA